MYIGIYKPSFTSLSGTTLLLPAAFFAAQMALCFLQEAGKASLQMDTISLNAAISALASCPGFQSWIRKSSNKDVDEKVQNPF